MSPENNFIKKAFIANNSSIFSNQKISSIEIHKFLIKELGKDWWELRFDTIEQLLKKRFGIDLVDSNREKVQALKRLSNSNLAFIDWYEFNILSLSLNNSIVDFEYLTQPTPGMIINTVNVMNEIRPDQKGIFGKEVKSYISLSLMNDGIYTPPNSLVDIISKTMSKLVSPEMVNMWVDTMKYTYELINGKPNDDSDTIKNVQGNRLLKAEIAALSYS